MYEMPDKKVTQSIQDSKKFYDVGTPPQGMLTKGAFPAAGTSQDTGGSGIRDAKAGSKGGYKE